MNGKDKLLYLIENYKTGNYSTDDFCSLYTNAFNHETEASDFTGEELEHYKQFMQIASRYSPYDEDLIKYPGIYNDTETINEALFKLCEYLHLE